jgi:hypothetical protein
MSLWLGISFLETLSSGALPDKNKERKKRDLSLCFVKVNLGCFSIEKTNDSASVVPKKLASKSRENISYLVVYKCSILEIIKKRY